MRDELLIFFAGIGVAFLVVFLLMIIGSSIVAGHNSEFLCETHNKEVLNFEVDGYKLTEVTCFSQSDTFEKFVKGA